VVSLEAHLSFVQSLVEEDCLIVTSANAQSVLTPETSGGCSLCLIDGRVIPSTARLLESCGVTHILGTKGIRQAIPDWTHDSWKATHWDLGGVTTAEVTGVCLSRDTRAPVGLAISASVGCDASTVLSVKAPAKKY
jgi:hypothetical protein